MADPAAVPGAGGIVPGGAGPDGSAVAAPVPAATRDGTPAAREPGGAGGTGAGDDTAAPPALGATAAELWTLATWFSPAYPVGAFSFSHGLEWAVQAGDVRDAATLTAWIADCLELGAGRSDAILLVQAMRAAPDRVADLADLALALAASRERHLEQTALGAAFAAATAPVWGTPPDPWPYPVAVARAAVARGLPAALTVRAYLHAFCANAVSAALRLGPLGQTDGQRTLAALAPVAEAVATQALAAGLDDLGGCALRADLAAMQHETQYARLFRS